MVVFLVTYRFHCTYLNFSQHVTHQRPNRGVEGVASKSSGTNHRVRVGGFSDRGGKDLSGSPRQWWWNLRGPGRPRCWAEESVVAS